jgi:hypothetical protein
MCIEKLCLPALFYSSDALASTRQRRYYSALALNLSCLVVASALSCANVPHWGAATLQGVTLLTALAASIYIAASRPVRHWYAARALAESVKTLGWRFACKCEPFLGSDDEAKRLLAERISGLAKQNSHITLTPHAGDEFSQVTSSMSKLRHCSAPERLSFYLQARVDDQLKWYTQKAQSSERTAVFLFSLVLIGNSVAVIFAFARVHYYSAPYWPTDMFVTLSACVLSWFQAKKSGELSASYSLAAHEIAAIRDIAPDSVCDVTLSQYVDGAENAFSREHTQWIARLDH